MCIREWYLNALILKATMDTRRRYRTGGRAAPEVTAGTRLVREWNGRTIDVMATKDGMVWEGRTYRSLTAIAREVTSTPWSGPRFFGIGAHA